MPRGAGPTTEPAVPSSGWRGCCGVSPAAARDHLGVARRLQELPALTAAFSTGEISFWQARALCGVATAPTEQALLDIARHTTAAQLERVVGAFSAALERTELERANARHERRALNYHFDDDGFLVVRARLTREDGAVFVAALEAAAHALGDERKDAPDVCEPEAPEQRRADALAALATASLGAEAASARRVEVTAETCRSRWDGAPVDVDLCTFVLLQEAGLLTRPPPGGETRA